MAKVQKSVPKGRKKKWYKIIGPKLFNNQEIGESYVYEPKQLIGKNIKSNLMTLLRDPKKQNINMFFVVDKLDGNKGLAKIKGMEIVPAFMKRIVRRGKNRVDISFTCKTKDKVIRVKPILLTRGLTHKPVQSALRKAAKEAITKTFKQYTFDNLIRDLIAYKLQNKIKKDLSKIYPLKSLDIRSISETTIKKEKKTVGEEMTEEDAEEATEEEVTEEEMSEEKEKEEYQKKEETGDDKDTEETAEEEVTEEEEKEEGEPEKE